MKIFKSVQVKETKEVMPVKGRVGMFTVQTVKTENNDYFRKPTNQTKGAPSGSTKKD